MQTESRLEVAHIIPRSYYAEVRNLFLLQPLINSGYYCYQWIRKEYPSKITDTGEPRFGPDLGLGEHNMDTIQNVITLRTDLSLTWESFDFCVDPAVSFTDGSLLAYA